VIRSELFHYGPSGQNITLDNLQQHLAMLHTIDGWSGSCEAADVTHALWLGTGRDCVGSLLLDMAEYWDRCKPLATYDERLLVILHDFHVWCRESGARPSAVDEMSIFHQHH
ncbi:Cpr, partial [Symbiodinium pilosum]